MLKVIEVKNLHKYFKNNHVLKNINFSVKQGETIAILGPSGSGKSTLLRCLNLLEIPSEGKFLLNNLAIDSKKITKEVLHSIRLKTGMVFQSYHLFLHMTALQNVAEGLITVKKLPKKEAYKISREILAKVGLSDRENYYPAQLSGGQQQRVGIARSLAMNPKVLLFDEPTSALDPELVFEVLSVIKDVAKSNMTMLIVTHEMEFAKNVADRIIFMADGEIVETNKAKEFFLNPLNDRTKQFLGKYRQEFTYEI